MATKIPEAYSQLLDQLQSNLVSKTETIDYNPLSPSALKSAIAKALRPGYDKAIQNRQATAATNRAAIDADAAARGVGASTWVTDVKNRQNDAAAKDIAGLESDYSGQLYQNLLSRLSDQESKKLTVDQFNAQAKQNALAQALSLTDKYWEKWGTPVGGGSGKSGGGGGGGSWTTFTASDGSGTTDDMYKYVGNVNDVKKAYGLVDAKTNIKKGADGQYHIVDKNGNKIFT